MAFAIARECKAIAITPPNLLSVLDSINFEQKRGSRDRLNVLWQES